MSLTEEDLNRTRAYNATYAVLKNGPEYVDARSSFFEKQTHVGWTTNSSLQRTSSSRKARASAADLCKVVGLALAIGYVLTNNRGKVMD